MPSDLLGVGYLHYEPHRSDRNLVASMGPACSQIRRIMEELGRRESVSVGTSAASLGKVFSAASQIYHCAYREEPRVDVLNHMYHFTLDSSGGCVCRERRVYEVKSGEYFVDAFGINGEAALPNFEALQLTAGCADSSRTLPVLPSYDAPNQKRFLLFFLPSVLPGHQVEFTLDWQWPGMWASLAQGRPDHWRGRPKPSMNVRQVEFCFHVPVDFPKLEIRHMGKVKGALGVDCKRVRGKSLNEYRYTLCDLISGNQYVVELRTKN